MEYLDILDEEGRTTGLTGPKDEVKQSGLWHRVVNLWILTPDRRILQMKRASGLTYFPGYWGTIGGHVQAGESSSAALLRETEEELGLKLHPRDLEFLFTDKATYPWKDRTINVFRDVYRAFWSGDLSQLTPDPREADALAWFAFEELKGRYEAGMNEVFPLPEAYLQQLWKNLFLPVNRNTV